MRQYLAVRRAYGDSNHRAAYCHGVAFLDTGSSDCHIYPSVYTDSHA